MSVPKGGIGEVSAIIADGPQPIGIQANSTSDGATLVLTLAPNDVVLGRGARAREYTGTKQFHDIIREHSPKYSGSSSWEQKNIIAYRCINCVSAMTPPGRFVRELTKAEAEIHQKYGNAWIEVDCATLLKKTKQALRDSRQAKGRAKDATERQTSLSQYPYDLFPRNDQLGSLAGRLHGVFQPIVPSTSAGLSPHRLCGLGLFSTSQALLLGAQAGSSCLSDWYLAQQDVVTPAPSFASLDPSLPRPPTNTGTNEHGEKRLRPDTDNTGKLAKLPTLLLGRNDSPDSDEHEVAKQLVAMGTSQQAPLPQFTADDERREREGLTEAETQAALADILGQSCRFDKRQRSMQCSSIESLLSETRREVGEIPWAKKTALHEALKKVPAWHFGNHRLELFLRAEKMVPKKAAQRVVLYWEERKAIFGPDKFCLPMTLRGALRDDRVALEAGMIQLIPGMDASGRTLMWVPMKKREGYTANSALRAIWYVFEVALEHPNISKGIVYLSTAKNASLWDFDVKVDGPAQHIVLKVLPVTLCAFHGCQLPPLICRYILPIWLALADRDSRCRTLVHDVQDSQLMNVLSGYGLSEEVVPTELGGKCQLDQHAWVEKRWEEGK